MGDDIPKSVWVDENIYWGGDIEYIRNLIDQEKMNKSQIRFFLGYSGWAAGQLEKELKDNSWVIVKVSNDIVLNDNNADKNWKRVLRSLNNKYRFWLIFPNHRI
jgi:putative transcriptional regulator